MKKASAKKQSHWLNKLPGGGNILAAGKNTPIWQHSVNVHFGKYYTDAFTEADVNLELKLGDGYTAG